MPYFCCQVEQPANWHWSVLGGILIKYVTFGTDWTICTEVIGTSFFMVNNSLSLNRCPRRNQNLDYIPPSRQFLSVNLRGVVSVTEYWHVNVLRTRQLSNVKFGAYSIMYNRDTTTPCFMVNHWYLSHHSVQWN